MGTVKHSDLEKYVTNKGGSVEKLKNGNYNIRKDQKSANVGKHKNNRWDAAQFTRAWGSSGTGVGIADPKWS